MAVEKNAVRKGTRWMFCANVVVVDEVTDEHVIYRKHDVYGLIEVVTLRKFLDCARDAATAEHERLMDGLLHAIHGQSSDSPMGTLLGLLRDAAIWQLERAYPATPVYVPPPAPKPAPVEDKPCPIAMPLGVIEEGPCDVALPHYEPQVEVERPSRKLRTA